MTEAQPYGLWAGAGLAALLALWAALFAGPDAGTSRRILVQFLFRIALPITILLGLPLVLLARTVNLEDRLWQALIAGLVIAMGWLTTAMFTEIGRSRQRAERLRDYHKAIYAEIGNNLNTLWTAEAIDGYAQRLIGRMKGDPDFVPFIPKEHNDHVYDAIIDRIDVLPRQTIDAIVAYYSQVKAISAIAEDMRGDAFKTLSQDRRIAMYSDYVEMKKQALAFGTYATNLIRAYADGGAPAAEALIRAVSSRAEARSGRSPGSE